MYYCGRCKKLQPKGTEQSKLVIDTRQVEYHNQERVTKGWEIVREIPICPDCVTAIGRAN